MGSHTRLKKDSVALTPEGEIRKKKIVHTPILLILFLTLGTLGMLNLFSASAGSQLFYSQLQHMVVGALVFAICGWFVQPRHLNAYAYWIFGATISLLVAVLILGHVAGGSQRWVVIGPLRGQPSELAKIVVAIIVARFFAISKLNTAYRLRDLWPVFLMVGAIAGLIFPQPDFGTAGFCVLIAAAQLFFIRFNFRSVSLVVTCCTAAAPIVWSFLLQPYQKSRILSFLSPDLDPHGSGYNALQSLVAVGSGGLIGKGYLQGTQNRLQFLPMRHTDFVFSVFAEEQGFWGGALLFILFATLTYVALEIARRAKDTFSALLAIGLAAFIFLEFTINVAMVLRMFPVVGLPLPFFSYGGSALITVCAALGLLVSIDRNNLGLFKKRPSLNRTVS